MTEGPITSETKDITELSTSTTEDELTPKETIPTQLTTGTTEATQLTTTMTEATSAVTEEDPRFKTAFLNCIVEGHDAVYVRTAAILELCLKILAPTRMDTNGRLKFDLQDDDEALRKRYKSRFMFTYDSKVIKLWEANPKFFDENKVQHYQPGVAGYGFRYIPIKDLLSTGILQAFLKSITDVNKEKVIIGADISGFTDEILRAPPSMFQRVGLIIGLRTTYGQCIKRGMWYEETYLTRAVSVQQTLPVSVGITTTAAVKSLFKFNETGDGCWKRSDVSISELKSCPRERAPANHIKCGGRWFAVETSETLSDMVSYGAGHGIKSYWLQDSELLEYVAEVVERNLSVLKFT
ncbi:uncharacterized protein LOC144108211 [Amblyomma americanum]